ncbi:hypothetical protein DI392_02750 [Vibrio albus]|uniref:DUF2850 domain-containing protein n=1 Tax=Vibrio albus TaxID=2200953 RepID=A0A2U3BEK9_9VIBR|nr:DUF2850 domain-containing protein [Vibrio albus]PWI35203.1 hypothetical protein DI392_02750 [Vibrio albus]
MVIKSKSKQRKETGQKLRMHRGILAATVVVAAMIFTAVSVLHGRYQEDRTNAKHIYGEWVEQGVPDYARDSFTVAEEGIYIEGRIIDTNYHFDGKSLTYTYQGKEYQYLVKDSKTTVMRRVAPLHYQSLFHLAGKYQPPEEDH